MLDLNSALGNNTQQANLQLDSPTSFASQLAAPSSMSFNDLLSSVQAESEQFQTEPTSVSATPYYFQSANSLPVYSSDYQGASQGAVATSSNQIVYGDQSSAYQSSTSKQTPVYDETAKPPVANDKSISERQTPTQAIGAVYLGTSPDGIENSQAVTAQGGSQSAVPKAASSNTVGPITPGPQPSGATEDSSSSETSASDSQQTIRQLGTGSQSLAAAPKNAVTSSSSKTAAAAPDDQESLPSVPALGVKSIDKSKTLKEIRTSAGQAGQAGQAGLVNGVAGTNADPVTAAAQATLPVSNAGSLVTTDGGVTPSELPPKTRGVNKADSTSGLAFAVKIQGDDSTMNTSGVPPSGGGASLDLSATQTSANAFAPQLAGLLSPLASKAGVKQGPDSEQSMSALPGAGVPVLARSSENVEEDVTPVDDAAPTAALVEDQPASTQLIKSVQVQITGADDQKVDLKLVEKSGSLTMSVRSSDESLTKALQQNLPELSTKLSDQQVRAEWWRPDAQETPVVKTPESAPSGGSSANQDQSGQNKGNSGQQGGRGSSQPAWLEDHITSRKSNQNGMQFSWHQ